MLKSFAAATVTSVLFGVALSLSVVASSAAAEPLPTDVVLPPLTDIFVVAFEPQPAGTLPYFDQPLFMAVYPKLRPAKVKIAVGARRIWQRGVIVTKDKKVLFWSTCARSFIAVETSAGQRFFGREAEVFVE